MREPLDVFWQGLRFTHRLVRTPLVLALVLTLTVVVGITSVVIRTSRTLTHGPSLSSPTDLPPGMKLVATRGITPIVPTGWDLNRQGIFIDDDASPATANAVSVAKSPDTVDGHPVLEHIVPGHETVDLIHFLSLNTVVRLQDRDANAISAVRASIRVVHPLPQRPRAAGMQYATYGAVTVQVPESWKVNAMTCGRYPSMVMTPRRGPAPACTSSYAPDATIVYFQPSIFLTALPDATNPRTVDGFPALVGTAIFHRRKTSVLRLPSLQTTIAVSGNDDALTQKILASVEVSTTRPPGETQRITSHGVTIDVPAQWPVNQTVCGQPGVSTMVYDTSPTGRATITRPCRIARNRDAMVVTLYNDEFLGYLTRIVKTDTTIDGTPAVIGTATNNKGLPTTTIVHLIGARMALVIYSSDDALTNEILASVKLTRG